jgi:hypothetical protein
LEAIPRFGREGTRLVLEWRARGAVFGSLADLVAALESAHIGGQGVAVWNLVTAPTRLLVISRGWSRTNALTHEIQAVYELTDTGLVLKQWTEREL